jgi:hypothetical protein
MTRQGHAQVNMETKPCGCVYEWEHTLNTATLGGAWYTRKLMQIRKCAAHIALTLKATA